MTTENIIKLNQIIGKALVEAAREAHDERITKMKERPFDEVIEAIKNRSTAKCNLVNGYFLTEAVSYFDKRLETEDNETWYEVEVEDNDWFEAIEQFRW